MSATKAQGQEHSGRSRRRRCRGLSDEMVDIEGEKERSGECSRLVATATFEMTVLFALGACDHRSQLPSHTTTALRER